MPINFDLAPKRHPEVEATPTPETIEAYAPASGDEHPSYRAGDNQIAPPVSSVVPGIPVKVASV